MLVKVASGQIDRHFADIYYKYIFTNAVLRLDSIFTEVCS